MGNDVALPIPGGRLPASHYIRLDDDPGRPGWPNTKISEQPSLAAGDSAPAALP